MFSLQIDCPELKMGPILSVLITEVEFDYKERSFGLLRIRYQEHDCETKTLALSGLDCAPLYAVVACRL